MVLLESRLSAILTVCMFLARLSIHYLSVCVFACSYPSYLFLLHAVTVLMVCISVYAYDLHIGVGKIYCIVAYIALADGRTKRTW